MKSHIISRWSTDLNFSAGIQSFTACAPGVKNYKKNSANDKNLDEWAKMSFAFYITLSYNRLSFRKQCIFYAHRLI